MACRAALGEGGELVVVEGGSQVPGWGGREWVFAKETQDGRLALEEAQGEIQEPLARLPLWPERYEPLLPVEPGLMGFDEFWTTPQITGLVLEFIGLPMLAVVA